MSTAWAVFVYSFVFHRSEDLTAARCNKSGSPVVMFGIVVASCYEPTPEGTIEGC
jgi:hypothetical protein